jgi:hypothetical protein
LFSLFSSKKLFACWGLLYIDPNSIRRLTTERSEARRREAWTCLGHMSKLGMAELVKRELIDGCDLSKFEFCEHCIFGKHKSVKFNASVHTTKGILDYAHADVWGPSRRTSNGGANYMLTIIDDYSRKVDTSQTYL